LRGVDVAVGIDGRNTIESGAKFPRAFNGGSVIDSGDEEGIETGTEVASGSEERGGTWGKGEGVDSCMGAGRIGNFSGGGRTSSTDRVSGRVGRDVGGGVGEGVVGRRGEDVSMQIGF
jgi:hypothetical protein